MDNKIDLNKDNVFFSKMEVYTDGGYNMNKKIGAYAFIFIEKNVCPPLSLNSKKVEQFANGVLDNGNIKVTNNTMELYAFVSVLEIISNKLKRNKILIDGKDINLEYDIKIFSDSKYVVNCFNDYLENWVKSDWKLSSKNENGINEVKNKNIWKNIYSYKKSIKEYLVRNSKFEVKWVKGHSDNEWNNRTDKLCNKVIKHMEENVKKNIMLN